MQVIREREFKLIDERKEKIKVMIDIPVSMFKTKDEIKEELGDDIGDITPEKLIDEVYGEICTTLVYYLVFVMHCGYHYGDALMLLQDSIIKAGFELGLNMREWKTEDEKMR
ncbi:MAG: hypothetical protein PHP08_00785 [Candidatus Dojkabacteria bacterium]|nr:hypothetical protein [Candidatus Dojkabacteria bacterium]